jgi:CubicO group peptidase (beta-lactamase class C family)
MGGAVIDWPWAGWRTPVSDATRTCWIAPLILASTLITFGPLNALAAPPSVRKDAAVGATAAERARLAAVAQYYAGVGFMGAVLVAQGDQVLLSEGYGSANLEWGEPDGPGVKYRLGSLTKQFTAALVMLMQQDGKLNVHDPVRHYLPDAPRAWDNITIVNLLGHTSGILDFTADDRFATWSMSARTPAEILAFFKDKPLDFAPGTKFAYSNSNYQVLGVILEKVSGQSYGDLLRHRLFDPLGMADTGLDSDDLVLARRAQGYRREGGRIVQARSESMSVPWAAGSIYSTTDDLLKWDRALFSGRVVSPASLSAMTTPGLGGYGLGLEISRSGEVTVIRHTGGIEGFNSYMASVPDRRIAVIVLANVNGWFQNSLGTNLLDVALGRPAILPNEHETVATIPAQLSAFAGEYKMSPGFSATFTAEAGKLIIRLPDEVHALQYEGAIGGRSRFYSPAVDLEIEFDPPAEGGARGVTFRRGGTEIEGVRVSG